MNRLAPKAKPVAAPFLVALNLTRRCNQACAHCYLDAGTRRDGTEDELSTDELKALIDDIASLGGETMIVLTGGEPLLRPDLDELARHAAERELMVVIGSNGMTLDAKRVRRLKQAGVSGVGISLDSLDPAYHDAFRGVPGAWARTMNAIDACRAEGLPYQLHFSVTDDNANELDGMIDFAKRSEALVLNVFFLVCTGRGEKVTNISRQVYDHVLRQVTEAAHREQELLIRAKCAPHFKRMAMELDPEWPITLAQGYEAGGCLAGSRYCRVTPMGEVTACPYIEDSAGSVRDRSFAEIWETAPMFQQLRKPSLEGRCGECEYRKLCGGCRARPLARDGELMGEDFLCDYTPKGEAVIEPLPATGDTLSWTREAEERFARIPPFLRRMIRGRAEDYVRAKGRSVVTADDLSQMAKRRFGSAMPARPQSGAAP
ncbi:MAG: radical SAM protein [Rhodospirillales bacterium]|nr:radical SAM protein [Rhodospirillales bacterium]MDP6643153.1 radical SAM protein [Rhodospirillales bacterium]MDP6840092.1 radical SAM protein [Rhodospirillales bacterium]